MLCFEAARQAAAVLIVGGPGPLGGAARRDRTHDRRIGRRASGDVRPGRPRRRGTWASAAALPELRRRRAAVLGKRSPLAWRTGRWAGSTRGGGRPWGRCNELRARLETLDAERRRALAAAEPAASWTPTGST